MPSCKPSTDDFIQPSPGKSARKAPASERKIRANRRNALRSTGPKTTRGKRNVSRNAITHGIFAREVVISAGDGLESRLEFNALLRRVWECYWPVGVIEESLVQTIGTCWWRKARVLRAENGEIRKRLDTLKVDRQLRHSEKSNLALAIYDLDLSLYNVDNEADGKISSQERWSAMQEVQRDLMDADPSLAYLGTILKGARSEITRGELSIETGCKILRAFCFLDFSFAITCIRACGRTEKADGQANQDTESNHASQKRCAIVGYIDGWIDRIALLGKYASERESLKADADARSFCLPPADVTDKLLRYEAHLDRQLSRAMDQLERLQRTRKGEFAPAPINLSLSKGGN